MMVTQIVAGVAPMELGRIGLASAQVDGEIWVISGHETTSVEIYNIGANQWRTGVAVPSEINHGSAITVQW